MGGYVKRLLYEKYEIIGSVSTVTAGIFHNEKKNRGREKTSVFNIVAACQKNNKVLPKNVKNVADKDKNESLKEAKTELK